MATDKKYKEQWKRCLEFFKCNIKGFLNLEDDKLAEQEYQTWFRPIVFISFDEEKNELVLGVPSNYFSEMLDGKFRILMFNVLWRVFGSKDIVIVYRVQVDSEHGISNDYEATSDGVSAVRKGKDNQLKFPAPKRKPDELDSQLNQEQRFDNFIEGDSNRLARSVGLSIAEKPQQVTFNPFFIYGSSGVGKTHLVNAIGTRAKELFPNRRVLYLGAHQFALQYAEAKIANVRPEFIRFYQSIDLLIIDDIQELAGQTGTQNEFFHIFNHLKQNGKQIIMTSDRRPADLQGMEERLLTRFTWGLTTELEKPNQELCRKILVNKIRRDGLTIPEDVIDFIATNVNDSVRELEGIVNSLMAFSVVYSRDIDIPLAEQVLGRVIKKQKPNITLDNIVEVCCRKWQVTHEDIYSTSRKATIVLARQVAMYLAQKLLKMSASRIGLLIGGRSHATVLHAIKQTTDRISLEKPFAKEVESVERELKKMR